MALEIEPETIWSAALAAELHAFSRFCMHDQQWRGDRSTEARSRLLHAESRYTIDLVSPRCLWHRLFFCRSGAISQRWTESRKQSSLDKWNSTRRGVLKGSLQFTIGHFTYCIYSRQPSNTNTLTKQKKFNIFNANRSCNWHAGPLL